MCTAARDAGIAVRGYVSVVLGCPFEGAVDPAVVAGIAGALSDLGCYEISLGDTIGVGTPRLGGERLVDLQTALMAEDPRFVIITLLEDIMKKNPTTGDALLPVRKQLKDPPKK